MTRAGRVRLLQAGFVGAWCVLLGRSAWLQLVEHDRWIARARAGHETSIELPAIRGEIVSSDGVTLARSVPKRSLAVDPRHLSDPEKLADRLQELGIRSRDEFLPLALDRRKGFLWVTRSMLPNETIDRLLAEFPALDVVPESARLHPLGAAGGATIGVVGRDDVALGGLEARFSTELQGRAGAMVSVGDATGGEFQGLAVEITRAPSPGSDLRTTLHSRVQEIAAARLEQGVVRERAKGGFVIVTRPQTGEVLAMADYPTVDPEDPQSWQADNLRSRGIQDAFEPGSSYKVVAFAAGLEAGVIEPDDPIDCMMGRRSVPGGIITDHHSHGVLTVTEVLGQSSNIGTGIIAERAGREWFYRMERAFGFGPQTGIDLPGEARGRILEPSAWSARSLVTQAFGQEISVTGVQLAMAYGAIANGGLLLRPLLARELRTPEGVVSQRWEPEVIRRVIEPDTAEQLRDMLRFVVTDGTGKKAEVEGYPTAGKTSTAQKYIPEEGSYSNRRYLAGFAGFAPFDDPQILCIVYVDEPTSDIYGGNVAAPIFREIVGDLRGILPGASESPSIAALVSPESLAVAPQVASVPDVIGLSTSVARRVLVEAGMLPRVEGVGDQVVACRPPVGESCEAGSVVTLALGSVVVDSLGPGRRMPALMGLSMRDALVRLRSLETPYRAEGTGWVIAQTPASGELLASGQSCSITLGPDSCLAWKEFLRGGEHASRSAPRGDLVARARE